MWFYILSGLFLIFVLIYEPKPSINRQINVDEQTYFVSLVTVKNDANAPFYYHTSLELIKKGEIDETISYGFFPDHSGTLNNVYKPLKSIYRFLRPIYAMPARIRSPDPLYEGSSELGIKPGKIVYREVYPVLEKEWFNLKYQIAHASIANELPFDIDNPTHSRFEMPLFYSYAGNYLSDNCSSWVRKLLNKHLKVGMSCQQYRFKVFGLQFAVPITPFDFPPFCSSPGLRNMSTKYPAIGCTNTTYMR